MPFQRVPDTANVQLVYGYGTGPDIINNFHVRDTTSPWSEASLDSLVDTFETWWNAQVKPLQHADLTLRTIRAADLDEEFGARHENSITVAGTRAGTAAAAVVAAIVKFVADPGSAPRRGLVYHPGLAEADIGSGSLEGAYATAVRDAYAELGSDLTAANGGWALVLVSRYSGKALVESNGESTFQPTKRAQGVTQTIASVVVPTRYGVQKRRRPEPL